MQFSLTQLLGLVFATAVLMYACHVAWVKDHLHAEEIKKLKTQLSIAEEKFLLKTKIAVPPGNYNTLIGMFAGTTVTQGTYVIVGNENVKYDLVLIGGIDLQELQRRVESLEMKK